MSKMNTKITAKAYSFIVTLISVLLDGDYEIKATSTEQTYDGVKAAKIVRRFLKANRIDVAGVRTANYYTDKPVTIYTHRVDNKSENYDKGLHMWEAAKARRELTRLIEENLPGVAGLVRID